MGGKVFTHSTATHHQNQHPDATNTNPNPNRGDASLPALHTPRMSPSTYFSLRDHLLAVLAPHYREVIVPREAPEKTSYGDVDVLVEGPLAARHVPLEELAKTMGATRWVARSSRTMSFAIPDPAAAAEEEEEEPEVYRQVDVFVCRAGEMGWTKLIKSDGDAWNIIGTMLRPVGITVNDVGLFVRVREIEMEAGWGREKAMVWLTSDLVEMMDFLGLDRGMWERGFGTVRELFDWIAGMRWFVVFERREEDEKEEEGGQKERKGLNGRDRRRVGKREMYRRWVEEYLPSCRPNTPVEATGATRERVLQEALDTFKKRDEYEAKLKHWKIAVAANNLWRKVADSLPDDGAKKSLTMRGLKKRIVLLPPDPQENETGEDEERDGRNSEAKESHHDDNAIPGLVIPEFRIRGDGTTDEEGFLSWVEDNWTLVYQAEKKRVDDEMMAKGNVKRR